MSKIIKEITLSPKDIWGLEFKICCQSAYKIVEYINKNLSGEIAPEIGVVKKHGVYQILCETPHGCLERLGEFGGHHRVLSGYISGHNLRCLLINKHENADMAKFENFSHVSDAFILMSNESYRKYRKTIISFPENIRENLINHCKFESERNSQIFRNEILPQQ